MKKVIFLFSLLLIFAGCEPDKPDLPERLTAVGSVSFGKLPSGLPVEREMIVREEKFLTDNDRLELFFTPLTGIIWRIDLVIPEFPGGGSCAGAAEFVKSHFNIAVDEKYCGGLPGTSVTIIPAYEFGPAGVRISFTDLEYRKLFESENSTEKAHDRRRQKELDNSILLFENAVMSFYNDTGVYPENCDQLFRDPGVDRWQGPYIDEIPCDPDGKKLIYRRTENGFTISSGKSI
jgi:hypothetical protein